MCQLTNSLLIIAIVSQLDFKLSIAISWNITRISSIPGDVQEFLYNCCDKKCTIMGGKLVDVYT